MKSMKKSNRYRLLTIVLVMALVFSLSVSAYAAGEYLYGDENILTAADINANNASAYIVGSTYDSSATVTVIFEAGDCLDYNTYEITVNSAFCEIFRNVSVTDTNPDDGINGVTVASLLDTIARNVNTYGLVFNEIDQPDEENIYFLQSVEHNGSTWTNGCMIYDGWTYRVNDKIPVRPTGNNFGYEATAAYETPIKTGDVIHFFFDMPTELDDDTGNMAANYIRGVYTSRTANSVTITLQGHKTWIDTTDYLDPLYHIYGYTNLGSGIAATLYDSNGNAVSGVQTETSGTGGTVVFSGNIPGGVYFVKTTSSLHSFPVNDDWYEWANNTYFINTSAYSAITIPNPPTP